MIKRVDNVATANLLTLQSRCNCACSRDWGIAGMYLVVGFITLNSKIEYAIQLNH